MSMSQELQIFEISIIIIIITMPILQMKTKVNHLPKRMQLVS